MSLEVNYWISILVTSPCLIFTYHRHGSWLKGSGSGRFPPNRNSPPKKRGDMAFPQVPPSLTRKRWWTMCTRIIASNKTCKVSKLPDKVFIQTGLPARVSYCKKPGADLFALFVCLYLWASWFCNVGLSIRFRILADLRLSHLHVLAIRFVVHAGIIYSKVHFWHWRRFGRFTNDFSKKSPDSLVKSPDSLVKSPGCTRPYASHGRCAQPWDVALQPGSLVGWIVSGWRGKSCNHVMGW